MINHIYLVYIECINIYTNVVIFNVLFGYFLVNLNRATHYSQSVYVRTTSSCPKPSKHMTDGDTQEVTIFSMN